MAWTDIPGWTNFEPEYEKAIAQASLTHRQCAALGYPKRPITLVEVGVAFGRSLACLARKAIAAGYTPQSVELCIVGVDPFLEIMGQEQPDKQWIGRKYTNAREAFEGFMADHAPEERNMVMLRQQRSVEAAASFDDRSIDFVWIDASHEYADVRADIGAWIPKVRPGGLIGGDDYSLADFPGVIQAVREVFADGGYTVRGRAWSKAVAP